MTIDKELKLFDELTANAWKGLGESEVKKLRQLFEQSHQRLLEEMADKIEQLNFYDWNKETQIMCKDKVKEILKG